MIKVKGKYSPDSVDVSKLKVFISYKSEDGEFASGIYNNLKDLGFRVFIDKISLGRHHLIPKKILEMKLLKEVNESDYFCIVVSNKSLKSEWVQFEFMKAIEIIGRVVFICYDYTGAVHPGDAFMAYVKGCGFLSRIVVRHTTLFFNDANLKNVKLLAGELMNDPDEYWADGRLFSGVSHNMFDLKQMSIRKKLARKMVLTDSQFNESKIIDVIPFDWEEAGCDEGDIDRARMWTVFNCGRKNYAKGISDGAMDIEYVNYKIKRNLEVNAFVMFENKGGL